MPPTQNRALIIQQEYANMYKEYLQATTGYASISNNVMYGSFNNQANDNNACHNWDMWSDTQSKLLSDTTSFSSITVTFHSYNTSSLSYIGPQNTVSKHDHIHMIFQFLSMILKLIFAYIDNMR
jgi:aspartyl/asparaginyl beta-hydroxylase (cupin superfamily)